MAGALFVAVLFVLALIVGLVRGWRGRRWLGRRVVYSLLPAASFDAGVGQVLAWAARLLDRVPGWRVPAGARAVRFRVESTEEGQAVFRAGGPPQVEQMLRSTWNGVQSQRQER